jgi:hypothetical protein
MAVGNDLLECRLRFIEMRTQPSTR